MAQKERPPGYDEYDTDPIAFHDWVKIQAHIVTASSWGVGAASVLLQYDLTPAQWGTAGGYWSRKMNTDPLGYLKKYEALSAKYMRLFAQHSAKRPSTREA